MKNWWKFLGVLLVLYTIIQGFLGDVPHLPVLHETIRNLYFHVTMWFAMMIILTVSLVYSIKFLGSSKLDNDTYASESANIGILFGIFGITTGSLWAKFTWGAWWVRDPQLDGAAITILTYLAYVVLRSSVEDEHKKARLAAVYNIFAYVMMIVFIGVRPKFTGLDSLHPGKGGNPGFNTYDLDSNMRLVFYPAIMGWTLIGVWLMTIKVRIQKINYAIIEKESSNTGISSM